MAATTEKVGNEQASTKTKHKLLKPIYYHGRLIDEAEVKNGIEVDLDESQVEMLRKEGCIA
jgi:hypothetical protein